MKKQMLSIALLAGMCCAARGQTGGAPNGTPSGTAGGAQSGNQMGTKSSPLPSDAGLVHVTPISKEDARQAAKDQQPKQSPPSPQPASVPMENAPKPDPNAAGR